MVKDFFDVALRQRGCRDFLPEEVPDEAILRMVDAATHAPSAENSQPWVFVVVKDAEVRRHLAEEARRLWSSGRPRVEDTLDNVIIEAVDHFVERGFGGATTLIVLGADRTRVSDGLIGSSIYPAAQNLMLAASALGYASNLTLFPAPQSLVHFPETILSCAVIPVGRPAKPLGPPRREPASSKMHRDRYGSPWTEPPSHDDSEDHSDRERASDRDDKLRMLLDRQDILDCIHRCARGMDRHDAELIASAYHSDAIDDHGTFRGSATDFIAHVNGDGQDNPGSHALLFKSHHHYVTNTTIVWGNLSARTETYYLFSGERRDGTGTTLVFGRYIDRFECHRGRWAIAERRVVMDSSGILDTQAGVSEELSSQFMRGTWNRADISYAPLGSGLDRAEVL